MIFFEEYESLKDIIEVQILKMSITTKAKKSL